jgi:N-hydroxyarylamine O-acetyltransferase
MMSFMRLDDYLRRTGLMGGASTTLDRAVPYARNPSLHADISTLRRLHVAHREAFLFENLTIQTGGRISLALEDLQRRFLDEGRGGYCFEHNTLFAAALKDLGFEPVVLLGRVRRGPPERWARTHMVLRMLIDGSPWLADVGFGGVGLLEPMPLCDGATSEQSGIEYTLRREPRADHPDAGARHSHPGLWVLSMRVAQASMDLYEFSEDPQTAGDVEVANHYTSTHPDSIFRRTLTIQRSSRPERVVLRHDVVTRIRDGRSVDTPVSTDRLPDVARDLFGVELPAGPFVFESYSAEV